MNTVSIDVERDELKALYRDLILDHARSPRHFGHLARSTHTATGINPLCGDKLSLQLQIDDHDVIRDAGIDGTGCAISLASASLLTDAVIGLSKNQALDFSAAVNVQLTGRASDRATKDIDTGKLHALDGVREFPARVKCATLAWHALNAAIGQTQVPVSTE